ncbi:uncharacterized protein ASPGLDRAFT_83984 [Aspergillus glaucus CBS 516.65]|uniref:Uncharacterized protein n=1 Tax=Aspergillus glaucus CBS 516.65 TaxID=1160497 RepID=A0A1L9VD37_ASPGL|nr:hypothetical protein ASPGLDRAFT_83984 [Aspergillus glaucus CBS 516.65]OJJ81810.1 hypothetical protein ASPGLDRAFT_83984 [Aspergillus glaucus CBS 516.65]
MPPIAVDTGSSPRYIGTVVSPSWFTDAISPDGDPDNGCHPQEAQALRDYHEGKITIQEAAYAISRPTATSQSTELNCERNKSWNLLIAALEEWPEPESSPIFALLKEMENIPEPAIREEAKHSVTSDPFWKELPDDTDLRRQLREKYIHIAALETRLVDEKIGPISLDWGYECLTDVFERREAIPDIQVLMAAEWLKRLARRIFDGALKQEEDWPFKRDYLNLRKGGNAMTVERWQYWKSRLEKYVREGLPESDSVAMAIQAMNVAEKEQH